MKKFSDARWGVIGGTVITVIIIALAFSLDNRPPKRDFELRCQGVFAFFNGEYTGRVEVKGRTFGDRPFYNIDLGDDRELQVPFDQCVILSPTTGNHAPSVTTKRNAND